MNTLSFFSVDPRSCFWVHTTRTADVGIGQWGMGLGCFADGRSNGAYIRDMSALETLRVKADFVILAQRQIA